MLYCTGVWWILTKQLPGHMAPYVGDGMENRRNLSPETITRFLQEIIKFLCLYLTSIAVSSFLLFPPWCCGTEGLQYSLLNTALGCAPLVNLQCVKSTSESSQPISSVEQIIPWLFSKCRGLTNPENTSQTASKPNTLIS